MKRCRIIAKVLDPGRCRYYRAGQEFSLGGFTPKGLCDSAYAVLSRDVQTMAYGGILPWHNDGTVRTHCPDPAGATWELRCVEAVSDMPEPGKAGSARPEGGSSANTFVVETCRGRMGGCRYALVDLDVVKAQIESAVAQSGWDAFVQKHIDGPLLPHHRLRIALAACPNACTKPQVRDIGLIAADRPLRMNEGCNACGQCRDICKEGAIRIEESSARLDPDACVACGLCAGVCPSRAIETTGVRLRVLVGGRLGRHPRWATELPMTISLSQAAAGVGRILSALIETSTPGETTSDTTDRLIQSDICNTIQSLAAGEQV